MTTPRSGAIFTRISSDQTGEGLGAARQLEDCRKLAAHRGWIVGDEYVPGERDRPWLEALSDVVAVQAEDSGTGIGERLRHVLREIACSPE